MKFVISPSRLLSFACPISRRIYSPTLRFNPISCSEILPCMFFFRQRAPTGSHQNFKRQRFRTVTAVNSTRYAVTLRPKEIYLFIDTNHSTVFTRICIVLGIKHRGRRTQRNVRLYSDARKK